MYREHRIAISTFLVFFVYGLVSYFSSGGFITPFIFSKIVLVAVSLYFFITNVNLKRSYLLFLGFVAMLGLALVDEFTIQFLTQYTSLEFLPDLSNSAVVVHGSFYVFFGFLVATAWALFKVSSNKWILIGQVLLVILSILLLYFQQYLAHLISLSTFFIAYSVIVNRLQSPEKSVVDVLSSLFLLLFLLELFKYLV